MKRALSSASKNKYLSLRDAAIISGYSLAELRNLIKAGLMPVRKKSRRLFIPLQAFGTLNKQLSHKASSKKSMTTKADNKMITSLAVPAMVSLVPFTTVPDPRLLRVLQPVTFAAVLAMTLHIGLTPVYAERIVGVVDMAAGTLALMGDSTRSLLDQTVTLPVHVAVAASEVAVTAVAPVIGFYGFDGGQVAGAATLQAEVRASALAAIAEPETYSSTLEGILVGIADASDSMQRFLNRLNAKTLEVLVYNNTFDKWDEAVGQFRW